MEFPYKRLAIILALGYALLLVAAGVLGGVTNFGSVHIADTSLTATPVLMVNSTGAGAVFEARDGATPVARVADGGDFSVIGESNLQVGDGSPTFTQDGEDAYIEGTTELGGDLTLTAQTTLTFTVGSRITPTGVYQPLTTGVPGSAASVTDIAEGTTTGDLLILHNLNATDLITIDGTGTTVECKADVVLDARDTLLLIWDGSDWRCLANYDNS